MTSAPPKRRSPVREAQSPADPLEIGFFLGLLVGEGHFGGDGRQPQLTLRMHTRHESLFRWLETNFPGGRLYGPYHHGGRNYYQWMARGRYLADVLVPLIRDHLPLLDSYAASRFAQMCSRYGLGSGEEIRPTDGEYSS